MTNWFAFTLNLCHSCKIYQPQPQFQLGQTSQGRQAELLLWNAKIVKVREGGAAREVINGQQYYCRYKCPTDRSWHSWSSSERAILGQHTVPVASMSWYHRAPASWKRPQLITRSVCQLLWQLIIMVSRFYYNYRIQQVKVEKLPVIAHHYYTMFKKQQHLTQIGLTLSPLPHLLLH